MSSIIAVKVYTEITNCITCNGQMNVYTRVQCAHFEDVFGCMCVCKCFHLVFFGILDSKRRQRKIHTMSSCQRKLHSLSLGLLYSTCTVCSLITVMCFTTTTTTTSSLFLLLLQFFFVSFSLLVHICIARTIYAILNILLFNFTLA